MRSFVKIKPSGNGKITLRLSFIDIGKSCLNREFFTSLMCLLMQCAKIKFSRKFPNLQYHLNPNCDYFPGTSDGSPQTSAQTVIPAPVTMVATSETRGTYRPPAVKFMMRSDFFPLLQANEVKI